MSAQLTEDTIKTYIKTMLGMPIVEVELDDEQFTGIINQSLGIYGTYKPIEKFGTVNVLSSQQKYSIAAEYFGRGIIEVFYPDLLRSTGTLDEFDVFRYHNRLPNLDPGDFYAERVWWKEVQRSTGADFDWFYENNHDGTAELYISPPPDRAYTLTYIFVKDPTLTEVPPTDDDWINDYCLAMAKQVLGRILRKHRNVQGAETSIDLDGDELVNEGTQSRQEMEEYLTGRGAVIAPVRG